MAFSLYLLYRVRDFRFGFLTLLLSLMATRQLLTLFDLVPRFAELPGLVVSVLGVVVVYYLLQYTRREAAIKDRLREANRELRRNQTYLEATVAASPDDLVVFDADGRCRDVFASGPSEMSADLAGERVADVRPDVVADAIRDAIETTVETGATERIEYALHDGDEPRWYEGRTARIRTVGADDRVLFIRRDVTDRREREQTLRRFRQAVEAAGAAIYITDRDEEIQYVNPAFEEITGYAEAEALGETPRILSSGEHDASYYEDLWATILDGETWREEIVNERKSGERYYANQTITPIVDADGSIDEFVAIQIDTTERKNRERHLLVLDRVLRHNLRNDMNVILGHVEQIEAAADTDAAADASVVRETVRSLLSKADTERKIVRLIAENQRPRAMDVTTVLEDQVAAARQTWPAATIDVEAPAEATAVAIDELDEAIAELLQNAIEHCDRAPVVTVSVSVASDSVTVRIADNGPGIPEQERQILSGQGDIDSLYHGSGIGLWFVYWVVQLSNGRLSFEANDPRGSVVVLEFPADSDRRRDG
ncbi:PAS domain S-box protein [Halorientalis brevis]|uniref:histidine kinase n=1 Tax=Halorientalis brevis TaxID=1126241 RepID=A0ABD6C802_9EURY